MRCTPFRLEDGTTGIVCSRGRRRSKCTVPGCGRYVERECDHPVMRSGRPATCDRGVCLSCARRVGLALGGDSVDFCPPHHGAWLENPTPKFRALAPVVRDLLNFPHLAFLESEERSVKHTFQSGPPSDDGRTAPLGSVVIDLVPWKLVAMGRVGPIGFATSIAKALPSLMVDAAPGADSREIIVAVQAQPLVAHADTDPDRWSFTLHIGAGRRPAERTP